MTIRPVLSVLASVAMLGLAAPVEAELLRRISFEYDELGRLITERHVEPATGSDVVFARHGYDAQGRRIWTTDALGRMTSLTYDELGRVVAVRDPAGGLTTFDYNTGDRLTKVTDPRGLATSYQWDGLGNLLRQDSPDTGRTSFDYSVDGLRAKMTRNDGSVTTYAYDGMGRLLQAKAGNAERNFTYGQCGNGVGRLCTAELRENGVVRSAVSHGYTQWGWLEQRRERGIDETGKAYDQVTAYVYDGRGLVTGIGYPGGLGVGYIYSAGRLAAMTATIDGVTRTVASNITHQPFGKANGWTYGNGLERLAHFDRNGRLFGLGAGTGSTLAQSLTYGFNAADEIVAMTDGVDGSRSRKFAYDALGRLRAETNGGKAWEFDANGNRTRTTEAGKSTPYVIDSTSNRLVAVHHQNGTQHYGYDPRGNRIVESAPGFEAAYRYDGFNRLREATVDGATSQYTVNALDQRIGKTTPTSTVRFTYAGQNQLLAEHGPGGWTSYLWLDGELVGLVKPDKQLRFVHNDHLGRPEIVTNSSRQAVWRANNADYGRAVALDQVDGLNIGFPGQYYDAETGLWQNGYRDGYDEIRGSYAQADPIGLAGGSYSTYNYVGANPINRVDPLGLADWYFGLDVDLVGIMGFEGGLGVVYDTDEPFDSGIYLSAGNAYGANVGVGIGGGYSCREIEGASASADANVLKVSLVPSSDSIGPNGVAIFLGPGIGASASTTYTWTLSPNVIIRALRGN